MATPELERKSPVFMGTDGTICHAVCWRPLDYHGVRGGLSVDLYCAGCVEHVSLPIRHLPGIPMVRHALEAYVGLASCA